MLISVLLVFSLFFFLWLASSLRPESGEGFYALISHNMMLAIFLPAFLLPLFSMCYSLRKYWQLVGGGAFRLRDFWQACKDAANLKNLSGGHGEGCNFEDEDRYSNTRKYFHQATLFGFLLCFASTSSGTILHYFFGLEAPYDFFSFPKLTGVPGGIILCLGTLGLAWLKTKADPKLGAVGYFGGEMAFVLLLFFVSASGLVLYAATGSPSVDWLLPLHLASVLCFFLVTPYSKMVHGFYRMAALTLDAGRKTRNS